MKRRGRDRKFSLCNFLTKNRRGTHVGMIISFVTFITFIVFIYMIINPAIETGEDKGSVIEYLEWKIIENTSANFTSTSIEIQSATNPGTNCVELQNFFILSEVPEYVITKNEKGEIQNEIYRNFGNLIIERNDKENRFFKIYSSFEFDLLNEEIITPCSAISDEGYNIGLIKTGKYVFEENIYVLMNYYEENYEGLLGELDIPPGTEFGFSFTKSDGEIIETKQEITDDNIYAEEIPVQYIDSNANILSGFINIKVW